MFQPDKRCKMCTLPEDIIKSVHYMRFVEGTPLQDLTEYLNKVNVEQDLKLSKFYPTSVSRHFKNHLGPEFAAAYTTQTKIQIAKKTSAIPASSARNVEDHLLAIVAPENLELFERLRDVMESVTGHLEIVDSLLPSKADLENPEKMAELKNYSLKDAYDVYIRLNKELRGTLSDLSKFLNLKSILRKFVEELLREYTHKVTQGFLEEMRYLQQELAPDDQMATALMREVSTNFANKLANATDAVIARLDRIIHTHMKD